MTTTVGLVAAGRGESGISGTLSMSGGTCTHTHIILSHCLLVWPRHSATTTAGYIYEREIKTRSIRCPYYAIRVVSV